LRSKALQRANTGYSWDAITDAYEKLFKDLAAGTLSP